MVEYRKPEAVLIPAAMILGGDGLTQFERLAALAAPLLQMAKGEIGNISGDKFAGCFFVRRLKAGEAPAAQPMTYQSGHPLRGEDRHVWIDLPDKSGIKLGYLKPEPEDVAARDPDFAAIAAAVEAASKDHPFLSGSKPE